MRGFQAGKLRHATLRVRDATLEFKCLLYTLFDIEVYVPIQVSSLVRMSGISTATLSSYSHLYPSVS
jgi:hypothetical protein